jgi:cullin-associated NEDD8-dissociated protein 1
VNSIGPLVRKLPGQVLQPMIEQLSNLKTATSKDSSIPFSALRIAVSHMYRPHPKQPRDKHTNDSYGAISRVLIPRLCGAAVIPNGGGRKDVPEAMLKSDPSKGVDGDALEVLIEIAQCFGSMLSQIEIQELQKAVVVILDSDRTGSATKKRAVVANALLSVWASDELLSSFVSSLIEKLRDPHLQPEKRRNLISIIGTTAKTIPKRFGPYLKTLTPFVTSALAREDEAESIDEDDDQEDELEIEVREAALSTLESCLVSCPDDMRAFTEESISAGLRLLTFDPNFQEDFDDDEMGEGDEELELDGDEDYEEEGGDSDSDDISWKIRRSAAKVLLAIVSTRGKGELVEDGTLYSMIAPALINRIKDRDESVKLEVLSTLGALVRATGDGTEVNFADSMAIDEIPLMAAPPSRKRRRGGSDASMFDVQSGVTLTAGTTSPARAPSPNAGPRANLSSLTPKIISSLSVILKGTSLAPKQSTLSLLKDIISVQHGGLAKYFSDIIPPVVDIVEASAGSGSGSGSSSATATATTLRVEALELLQQICAMHSSQDVEPYLKSMLPAVIAAVDEKFVKISAESLRTIEQIVKLITPPRSKGSQQASYLEQAYNVTISKVVSNEADVDVRGLAIHVTGILLGRTSGPEGSSMFPIQQRLAALEVLKERMKSEILRLASVRAVNTIAVLAKTKDDLPPDWVRAVALELGSYLRKANRALRGSSLGALRSLVGSSAGQASLDRETKKQLLKELTPILNVSDLHLLAPALGVLAKIIASDSENIIEDDLVTAVCSLARASLSGPVLDALSILVATIGQQGLGKPFMNALLSNAVTGDPTVVGKVIGTLLVTGAPNIGVGIQDFVAELKNAADDQRRSLALSTLGEAGLRLGSSFPVEPKEFLPYFNSKSDQIPISAAIALGRAGAGDVAKYLPIILDSLKKGGSEQYLFLHSVKEILAAAGDSETDITEYSKQIWESLISITQTDDNKAVGAECIGRLTCLDPSKYLPLLQV